MIEFDVSEALMRLSVASLVMAIVFLYLFATQILAENVLGRTLYKKYRTLCVILPVLPVLALFGMVL